MALSIGSASFADLPAGAHRTAGKYWLSAPPAGGEEREWQDVVAPAVDGALRKNHGFRARSIGPLRVLYVAASRAAVESAYNADLTALEGVTAGVTVTLPGGTAYVACYLESGSPTADAPLATEAGTWRMAVEYRLTQRRMV